MPTHAAFLRAVNLGSTRQVTGAELCHCLLAAGFEEVASFRTSGNVVFNARGSSAELTRRIERALEDEFGFEVPVFVRTRARVRTIAAHQPFPTRQMEASSGKLQVALLGAKPSTRAAKEVLELAGVGDRLTLHGMELYWLPSGGTRQSSLNLDAIARALGPYTMRTMGTVQSLAQKFFAD